MSTWEWSNKRQNQYSKGFLLSKFMLNYKHLWYWYKLHPWCLFAQAMMYGVWCVTHADVSMMHSVCMMCPWCIVCVWCGWNFVMYDARTVHLWSWSLILMHACRYDACIYDAANFVPNGRTNKAILGVGSIYAEYSYIWFVTSKIIKKSVRLVNFNVNILALLLAAIVLIGMKYEL